MGIFITVFIPAYNEEQNLTPAVQIIQTRLEGWEIAFEILIVDDGSTDNTGVIADKLSEADQRVRVLHHTRNSGIGTAFVTAISHASGEWFILIPADMPLEPDNLRRFLDAVHQADIIVGLRSDRSDYTFVRRVVSWVNIKLIQILFGMKEKQFQYISMYRTDFLRNIDIEYFRSAFFHAEVIIKGKALGKRITEVEITYAPRKSGRATGTRLHSVLATTRDMLGFWLRWIFQGPIRASMKSVS